MAAVAAFLKTRIAVIVIMLLVWESVDESLSIIIGTVQEIASCFLSMSRWLFISLLNMDPITLLSTTMAQFNLTR